MTNDEARRNDETQMTKSAYQFLFGLRASAFLRHSSFVLRHSPSDLVRDKWIVPLLLAHSRDRAVAWTDNRFVGKRQDFVEVVLHGVLVGNIASAHGTGEK